MLNRLLPNWLDSYIELANKSEAPDLYNRWMGMSVIASALQRRCFLEWDKDIYPNLFILIIGPSSARKGTAMSIAETLLQETHIKLASRSATREALILDIKESIQTGIDPDTELAKVHCSLTIFSPEIGVLLEGDQGKRMLPVLCDWFDCPDPWTYRTIGRGLDHIKGLWVNLAGATTPEILQTSLPKEIIGGGFLARCVIVYSKQIKRKAYPVLSNADKELQQKLVQDLETMLIMQGRFRFEEAYLKEYTKWYEASVTPPPYLREEMFAGYLGRRSLHLRKVTMILSAAESNEMILKEKHFWYALEELEQAEKEMHKVFRGYGKARFVETLPKVASVIANAYRKGETLTFQALFSQFYKDLDVEDMRTVLTSLQRTGYCKTLAKNVNGTMTDVIVYLKGEEDEISGPTRDLY